MNARAAADMLAYVYHAPGALGLRRVPRPGPGPGEAVMRVSLAAICGTDVRTHRHGNSSLAPPRVIGHEACGVIEEAGPGLAGFKEGDRVLVVPAIGCGACPSCRAGRTNMCERLRTIGFEYDGTFASRLRIPAQAFAMGNVLHLEGTVSDVEAALTEPVACCLNGQGFLAVRPGDFVFIFGAGFIGCMHAELALKAGAARVALCDVSDRRLALVSGLLPQAELVNSTRTDASGYVRDTTGGSGADVVISACPVGSTHACAMELSARRGRISLFGGLPGEARGFLDSNAIHYKELSVFGSHASTVEENRRILAMIAAREIEMEKYASRVYPLPEIEGAFEDLENETVLKVLLAPGREEESP